MLCCGTKVSIPSSSCSFSNCRHFEYPSIMIIIVNPKTIPGVHEKPHSWSTKRSRERERERERERRSSNKSHNRDSSKQAKQKRQAAARQCHTINHNKTVRRRGEPAAGWFQPAARIYKINTHLSGFTTSCDCCCVGDAVQPRSENSNYFERSSPECVSIVQEIRPREREMERLEYTRCSECFFLQRCGCLANVPSH